MTLPRAARVSVSVLVDNNAFSPGVKPAYGLSFYIEVTGRKRKHRVLFDTGPSLDILVHNAGIMGIDLGSVDRIVVSHFHRDHYGALEGLLDQLRSRAAIYVPEEPWFASRVLAKARRLGHRIVRVRTFTEVVPGIYTIGPVTNTREISLEILFQNRHGGLLVGCGHGGLPTISRWVRHIEEYLLVAGGFHLKEEAPEKAAQIASWILEELKPRLVVPLHCSNHEETFSAVLGDVYLKGGAGLKLELGENNVRVLGKNAAGVYVLR
jgi:7,8-dihydropterin-6-yl-methyl-4-(beta-D-ribofuranosyl)aminobenzene 5'-phosphate synthase